MTTQNNSSENSILKALNGLSKNFLFPENIRGKAKEFLQLNGLPTKKTESYRNTPLQKIYNKNYKEVENIPVNFISETNDTTPTIIFLDGKLYSVQNLPETILVEKIKEIPEVFTGNNNFQSQDAFTLLNTLYSTEGVLINVFKNSDVEKTVHIKHLQSKNSGSVILPTIFLNIESSSKISIVEYFENSNDILYNPVSRIYVDDSSKLVFIKIQDLRDDFALIDNTEIVQKNNSTLEVYTMSLNGGFIRNNLNINIKGQGSETVLHGASVVSENQHFDHNINIKHNEPYCNSKQNYKGIVKDFGSCVFFGKVIVEKRSNTN